MVLIWVCAWWLVHRGPPAGGSLEGDLYCSAYFALTAILARRRWTADNVSRCCGMAREYATRAIGRIINGER